MVSANERFIVGLNATVIFGLVLAGLCLLAGGEAGTWIFLNAALVYGCLFISTSSTPSRHERWDIERCI